MKSFWKDKKVAVTGHTGFKGSWLTYYLLEQGAKVVGISLRPAHDPSLFALLGLEERCLNYFQDISDINELRNIFKSNNPEVIFHLAAQAIVKTGYEKPFETMVTNTLGTVNLMEASRSAEAARTIVIVTTDKVYRPVQSNVRFGEEDSLGGVDPYSASKSAADILAQCFLRYQMPHGVGSAIVRAGNVVGGGDWSPDRLIPDIAKAWARGETVNLRMPKAIRPWQHVLEPTFAYMDIAQTIFNQKNPIYSGAFNIGPNTEDILSVEDVVRICSRFYKDAQYRISVGNQEFEESKYLALDNSYVKKIFNLEPIWSPEATFQRTMTWYQDYELGKCPVSLCNRDITEYEKSFTRKRDQDLNK